MCLWTDAAIFWSHLHLATLQRQTRSFKGWVYVTPISKQVLEGMKAQETSKMATARASNGLKVPSCLVGALSLELNVPFWREEEAHKTGCSENH